MKEITEKGVQEIQELSKPPRELLKERHFKEEAIQQLVSSPFCTYEAMGIKKEKFMKSDAREMTEGILEEAVKKATEEMKMLMDVISGLSKGEHLPGIREKEEHGRWILPEEPAMLPLEGSQIYDKDPLMLPASAVGSYPQNH